VASALALAASPAQAEVALYADNFGSGSSANDLAAAAGGESLVTSGASGAQHTLYGTSAAAQWLDGLAGDTHPFRADGTVLYSSGVREIGGAWASFTPQQGYTYTASATIDRGITAGSVEWLAFGFMDQLGNTLIDSGYATVAIRGDGYTPGGSSSDGFTYQGLQLAGYGGEFNFDNDGANDIEIVLNTMPALSTDWTVQYFIGGNSLGAPSLVTANGGSGDFGDISYLGFSSSSADATISNFSLTVVGGDAFADWIANYPDVGGQTGVGDDPDGDGTDSGVENFFGTNPGAFSQGIVAGTHNTVAGTFTFTHPLNATPASDLTATYRWSKDLSTFTADGDPFDGTIVSFSQGIPAGGFVTVTATVTGTPVDKLFVDVEVTQN
jgi:hypothetical protein